jgi:hypothetical protein
MFLWALSSLTRLEASYQGVTEKCRLSLLTNSAFVYAQMQGYRRGVRGLSQRVQLCT